jgi:hypothetical protein
MACLMSKPQLWWSVSTRMLWGSWGTLTCAPQSWLYSLFKVGEDRVIHGEFPVQILVSAHLSLHLIYLAEAEAEHALSNNTP